MYLAAEAFRYGATHSANARQNALDAFAALERTESINPLGGFEARTFELHGFKVSDKDRWRERPENDWDWKVYWFSVTLSFSVLSLATKSGLKAVVFYLGDQSPRPPGVYRFEAKSEVGKLGGARPPNFASGPGTALGLLPSIALSSAQVSLV